MGRGIVVGLASLLAVSPVRAQQLVRDIPQVDTTFGDLFVTETSNTRHLSAGNAQRLEEVGYCQAAGTVDKRPVVISISYTDTSGTRIIDIYQAIRRGTNAWEYAKYTLPFEALQEETAEEKTLRQNIVRTNAFLNAFCQQS